MKKIVLLLFVSLLVKTRKNWYLLIFIPLGVVRVK